MIDEISVKTAAFDLVGGKVSCELIDYRSDHFKVSEFFGTQRSIGNVPMYQI